MAINAPPTETAIPITREMICFRTADFVEIPFANHESPKCDKPTIIEKNGKSVAVIPGGITRLAKEYGGENATVEYVQQLRLDGSEFVPVGIYFVKDQRGIIGHIKPNWHWLDEHPETPIASAWEVHIGKRKTVPV